MGKPIERPAIHHLLSRDGQHGESQRNERSAAARVDLLTLGIEMIQRAVVYDDQIRPRPAEIAFDRDGSARMVVELRLPDPISAKASERSPSEKLRCPLRARRKALMRLLRRTSAACQPTSTGSRDESPDRYLCAAELAPQLDEFGIAICRKQNSGVLRRTLRPQLPSTVRERVPAIDMLCAAHERVHRQGASSRTSIALGKTRLLLIADRHSFAPCRKRGPTVRQYCRADSYPIIKSIHS